MGRTVQNWVSTFRLGWCRHVSGAVRDRGARRLHGAAGPEDFLVDDLDAHGAAAFVAPWRDLAGRSLDANAFFEPEFALAAAAGGRKNLRFLMVWQGRHERLLGVCPILLPRLRMPFAMGRLWSHKNSTCAMPLLDPASAERVWERILSYCRGSWPWLAGVSVAGARLEQGIVGDLAIRAYAPFERAVLDCSKTAKPFRPVGERTLRKCRRRLERLGRVDFRLERSWHGVAAALDAFLELEANGWKGGRGALANRPELAAFARAAVNGLASRDRCRIAILSLDGVPIAIGIVLLSARRAFFWKIAYDEAFARHSPGALLALQLTEALLADPCIDVADSCADMDHPMIDKLWPGREKIATCFLAIRPGLAFRIAVAMQIVRLASRQRLKGVYLRLRDRPRRSAPVRTP